MFERLTEDGHHGRRGRLAVSLALSTLLCGGAAFALSSVRPSPQPPRPREIDVALKEPPRPAPPPVAPPPPVPPPPTPAAAPKTPSLAPTPRPTAPPRLVEPVAVPLEKPAEAEPTATIEVNTAPSGPVADGEPGPAPAPAPKVEEPPPPPAPTRSAAPIELPEDAEPAVPSDANASPAFPEEARAKGLEGVVVLKVVVRLDGTVGEVRVLKGDEPFVTSAIAAVRSWSYSPALVGGQPVASYKVVKIPFRIR